MLNILQKSNYLNSTSCSVGVPCRIPWSMWTLREFQWHLKKRILNIGRKKKGVAADFMGVAADFMAVSMLKSTVAEEQVGWLRSR